MSHLGIWLSAQVDGELEGIERDRVLNHLAGCESCREEAIALRVLKRRMVALGDSGADSAIAGRLIERARVDQDLADVVTNELSWPASPRLGDGPAARQPWLSWRVATGSASTALVAIGVLAFVLGGSSAGRPLPKVSPAVDAYWKQHNNDTGQTWVTGAQARKPGAPAVFTPAIYANGQAVAGTSAGPGRAQPAKVPASVPAVLRLDSP